MARTSAEIKQLVLDFVNTNPGMSWAEWNEETYKYGLHHKFTSQLEDLQAAFPEKLKKLYDLYDVPYHLLETVAEVGYVVVTDEDNLPGLKQIKDRAVRISKKWRAVNAELAGRDAGVFGEGLTFDREYHGTDYYIDLTNGQDTRTGQNPDGLKHGNYTTDSGTGTTTLVDTEPTRTSSGDWDGAYIYNVTRSAGALITNSVYSAGWTFTHGTITGQTTGDTYYILDAWKTIAQYTSATTRSAGDNGYVRANTTETVSADILCDDDGSLASGYISLIGCDSTTNDPWGDSSDVLPTLDFNASSANNFQIGGDDYWEINRIHFYNSAMSGTGVLNKNTGMRFRLIDSKFSGHGSNSYNFRDQNYQSSYVEGCDFDGDGFGVYAGYALVVVVNCTFDGCSESGVYAVSSSRVWVFDSSFSASSANAHDIDANSHSQIWVTNCSVNGTDEYRARYGAEIYVDNEDAIFGQQYQENYGGEIYKETTTVRSGGGNSIKMAPNSTCTIYNQLSVGQTAYNLSDEVFNVWNWKKWMGTGSQTISLYIRADSAFSTYPTSSELFVRASYVSNATTGARTTVSSTAVLSDGSTWVQFSVTVNPAVASFVFFDVFLGWYQAGKFILVDEEEVVT